MTMAGFAANGFVRLDEVVPEALNEEFLAQVKTHELSESGPNIANLMRLSGIPAIPPGTSIGDAFEARTTLGKILRLPRVRGAIESLVGPNSLVDHQFIHPLPPIDVSKSIGRSPVSQNLHQDSTIDPRDAFDIQLFYFPHDVPREMGGTRFVPGTHLRIVSESAIGRYQNVLGQEHIVCKAGTMFFMHHGIWHGGGINQTDTWRYMYKLRLNPTVPQIRLWDTSDLLSRDDRERPIFFVTERQREDTVTQVLTRGLPWFENDTGRIEYIQRVHFWRRLIGDKSFDADYWVSRLECSPEMKTVTSGV